MFKLPFARSRIALTVLFMAVGHIAAAPTAFAQPSANTNNCPSADNPSDPCFSNVSDILQSKRRLLPVDDLVLSYTPGLSPNTYIVTDTHNSQMADPRGVATGITGPLFFTGVGRMWNLPRDVVVTYVPGTVNVTVDAPTPITRNFPLVQTPADFAMADFNGDGFDDFVLAMADLTNGTWHSYLQFVTAKDVNDLNQGLGYGPWVPATFPIDAQGRATVPISMTSGDLDGDGTPEVIVAYPDTLGGTHGVLVRVYRFSRVDSKVVPSGSGFFITDPNEERYVVMAGNFTGAMHVPGDGAAYEQLALLRYAPGATLRLSSVVVDIDNSRTPALFKLDIGDTITVATQVSGAPGVATGRLFWQGTREYIAVASHERSGDHWVDYVRIFSFDDTLQVLPVSVADGLNLPCKTGAVRDVAIGNYDQLDEHGELVIPDTLQVAVLVSLHGCPDNPVNTVLLATNYAVSNDPHSGLNLKPISSKALSQFNAPGPDHEDFAVALLPGDIQGRSLLLAAPTKATVAQHIQPNTILGLPPMHLDWLEAVGAEAPGVLNLTVYPEKYNAQYNFESTSSAEASRQSTTSFTYGFEESAEEKLSYGVPDIDSVSVTLKQSASQTFNNTVAKTFNHYTKQSFRLDASTVFDDLVAATVERINIYSYPVIGHCVKDSGGGDSAVGGNGPCPAGEHPLVLQFSAPDQIVHLQPTEGSGLEWYQSPQQPGQVFSYPGSLAQLKQEQPQTAAGASRLQLLSGESAAWGSQGGNEVVTVNWAEGGGSSVSSGSESKYSFDESVSVSGSTNIEGFGLSGSATFAANQSTSSATLNTSAVSFSDSTGITLSRGLGPDANTTSRAYLYEGQSYIFGQLPPAGTVDDRTPPETVKGQGFITVGYAADPLSTGGIQSGNWWKQTYDLPDIALNHPQRWQQTMPEGTNPERVAFNCPIGFSASFTSPRCTPNGKTPNPKNVATEAFYQMKGLFVTPGATTGGPQITRATTGDTVTLRARVYNYSLTNLPAGSTVHVRFYAQPWDNRSGQFTAGSGAHGFAKAVYIGEDVLDPIPAFCGGASSGTDDPCTEPNAPFNWVYAKITWKTPPLPGSAIASYWKFWVVAFAGNGSGDRVKEMPGHGLAAIPAADVNSLADIPIQTYSNNLGFYNQVFTVVAKSAPAPQGEMAAKTLTVTEVRAEKDGAPAARVQLNDRVQVHARHHVSGGVLDDVLVLFYDGNPAHGGDLIDMENVPRIPADGDFVTRVPFQPRSCGPHTLFVKALPADGTALPDMGTASINVTEDPLTELARMRDVVQRLRPNQANPGLPGDWQLDRKMKRRLLSRLWVVQGLFRRGRSQVAINRLNALESLIDRQRGEQISNALADALDQDINRLLGCLPV